MYWHNWIFPTVVVGPTTAASEAVSNEKLQTNEQVVPARQHRPSQTNVQPGANNIHVAVKAQRKRRGLGITQHHSPGARHGVNNVMQLLSRNVNAYEPTTANTHAATDIAVRFIEQAGPLRIRDGYVCASLADAIELLDEAGGILGAFARLEQVSGHSSADSNYEAINTAIDAFLAHPLLVSSTSTLNGASGARSGLTPDYGAITEASDRPLETPATDIKGLLGLNKTLLDDYFGFAEQTQAPSDNLRTAVARTLLVAAGGAMEAALTYLTQVFDIGTVQVFAAYSDATQARKPGTAESTKFLFDVTSCINAFAERLPLLMLVGHSTLTASSSQSPSLEASTPEQAASNVPQEDSTGGSMPILERKRRMSQWLQLGDVIGYISEFERPLHFGSTPQVDADFSFATQGVADVSRLRAALNNPQLPHIAEQLLAVRASRERRARREEDARKRALRVSVVDPDRPLGIAAIRTALCFLADEPGESGYLSVDCEANARIKLITAKLRGSIGVSYKMSNWGTIYLGMNTDVSAGLGIGAGVADAGINGEVGSGRSKKFTSHDEAAQFIYATIRKWADALSREVGPRIWNYLHFEDAPRIDPSKLGQTVYDTKRGVGADASTKLGTAKIGGSLGKTWLDRRSVDAEGKESQAQIDFTSASVFASARLGNLSAGINANATLGNWHREGQDTPFQFMSLGAGIDLTMSGGFKKSWNKDYGKATKNNIAKAVGKALERIRGLLVAKFPQLATSPSFTRTAWKSMRKEIITEIDNSAKSSKSHKMQYKLTASFAREARGLTDTGELNTENRPYTLSFVQLMMANSYRRSTGVDAKLFGVWGNTSCARSESLKIWLGDRSIGYCTTLYRISGSKPGAPVGIWKQILEGNPTEPFECMYGAVWNSGKGPMGVGSAGEAFMPLFLRMQEDELMKSGTVRQKTTEQSPEYLALLEKCFEQSLGGDVPDIGTISELDLWGGNEN